MGLRKIIFYGMIFFVVSSFFFNSIFSRSLTDTFRRIRDNLTDELIRGVPQFTNLGDCFFWWETFIGERLSFHHTVKRLIQEDKVPEDRVTVWYATSLILSNLMNPSALTREEKGLLQKVDMSVAEELRQKIQELDQIDEVIFKGIMEGYQEAMMANMTEAMYLGEVIPPELNQELIRVLRVGSQEAKKRAVQETLRYMVDCAEATREKFKEDFTKIVNETLGEALDRMGKDEIAIDDLNTIKELIKEKIRTQMQRRWQMQAVVVQGELKRVKDELYIDPRIQSNFPFLPLLVKAVLSQEPALLADIKIQEYIRDFMIIGMDTSWLTQIAENGSISYRGSIGLSPPLRISFIYKAVEEMLAANRALRLKIESWIRDGKI